MDGVVDWSDNSSPSAPTTRPGSRLHVAAPSVTNFAVNCVPLCDRSTPSPLYGPPRFIDSCPFFQPRRRQPSGRNPESGGGGSRPTDARGTTRNVVLVGSDAQGPFP